ncbi:MAG: hypothetical protein OEY59_03515 [Deltaproteobacteria bacterium]|nr:hypothetical protein [Deltaproteobacteria bacterium]
MNKQNLTQVLSTGTIGFIWQLVLGVLISWHFVRELGADGFGQLSLFMFLFHPAIWFDLTSGINSGVIAKLPEMKPDNKNQQILELYSATGVWWLLFLCAVYLVVFIFDITLLSWGLLLSLLLIPFIISIIYKKFLGYFYQRQYNQIYIYQISITFAWIFLYLLFKIILDSLSSLCFSTISVGILFAAFAYFEDKKTTQHKPYSLKESFRLLKSSFSFQRLFVFQAVVAFVIFQIDKLIISNSLKWDYVGYYFVPMTLLLKFPALLAVFQKPLLSHLSILWFEKNIKALLKYFKTLSLISAALGIVIFIPSQVYFEYILEVWVGESFAKASMEVIMPVFWLLPFAVFMLLGQAFLIAMDLSRFANLALLGLGLAHLAGTYLGIFFFKEQGISYGFFSDLLGGILFLVLIRVRLGFTDEFARDSISALGIIVFGLGVYLLASWLKSLNDLSISLITLLVQASLSLLIVLIYLRFNPNKSASG